MSNILIILFLFLPPIAYLCFHILYDFYISITKDENLTLLALKGQMENPYPYVTVIIPIYNEPPNLLESVLRSVRSMEYPSVETIVVHESPITNNIPELEELCNQKGAIFLHKKKEGKFNANAIRYALKRAKGEIIGILDCDYIVDKEWLKETIPLFSINEIHSVQCPQSYRNHENPVSRIAGAFRSLAILQNRARMVDDCVTCTGTMVLHRRKVLEHFFITDYLTEDFAFSLRMILHDKKIFYYPKVMGKGLGPLRAIDFCRQQVRWLDNLRIFRDFVPQLVKLPKRKFIHTLYHSTQFMYPAMVTQVLILAVIISFLNSEIQIALIIFHLIIAACKFLFCKFSDSSLKWRDFLKYMLVCWACYPDMLREVLNIMFFRKTSRCFCTPKELDTKSNKQMAIGENI